MWRRLRQWWPVGKYLLGLGILVAVGWRLAPDLKRPEVWQRPFHHPGWLAASGLLYLLGLGFSALYWYRLLQEVGQRPSLTTVVRAYYLGHFGKYLPGKAWALLLRATLSHGPTVHGGYAGLTAFYEVLTTMASGVLLAALLLAWLVPETATTLDWHTLGQLLTLQTPEQGVLDRKVLVLLALCLAAPVTLPLLPPLFNRLAHRVSLPFRDRDAAPLPRIGGRSLVQGLIVTAFGWCLLGVSLWAVLQATAGQPVPWSGELWGRGTAFLAIAYVAGFLLLVAPAGLGVREYFLTLFLAPELAQALALGDDDARKTAALTVVSLRVVWTLAELALAAVVYWLPGSPRLAAARRAARVSEPPLNPKETQP